MTEKPRDVIIIDDPDRMTTVAEMQRAIVSAPPHVMAAIPKDVEIVELKAEELDTLGPITIKARPDRAMVELGRNEPEPLPPPDRYHVEAEISAGELTALKWALASIKPRTNVAKAAIAALQRITKSRVAL